MRDGSDKRLNLLIVDDSVLMRALVRRAASLSNVPLGTIYEAGNGEEALRLLETASIDAVFTDLNMPVMTGFELLEVIGRDERWRNLLRVVISAGTSAAPGTGSFGVTRFVEKPFRPEAIRDALASLL
jgi:two-component system chemotaxis response regulator CheY